MAYYKKSYASKSADGKPKKQWNSNWGKKKSTVVPGSMYKPLLNPSDEQSAIIDAVVNGNDSLMIDSFAGCGKTSLCVESMMRVSRKNPHTSQGYLIYAKRNQEEAVSKAPSSVVVKTSHSFGMNAIIRRYGKVQVDKHKVDRIAEALVGPEDKDAELRYMLARAIELGKDYLAETSEDVVAFVEKHCIETCDLSAGEFADKVLKGMDTSALQTNIVSFSDLTWFPTKHNLTVDKFDILYLDEAQDLNPARIELVLRALGTNSRLVAVGDVHQSIFGFTGSDRHALDKLKERANAIVMPLHKTFRCGKAIVNMAKAYVEDYEAADTNGEGAVIEVNTDYMMSDEGAQAGDAILSRTNAPTVKIALKLLKNGKRCNIQGKDLGDSLQFMIKRSGADSVAGFESWLNEWANIEIEKLTAKNKDHEHITDKVECLESFCEGEHDLNVVKGKIKDMFADDADEKRIILSTIHKFKGLERRRVFRLEKSFTCRPKTEEDQEQERNIAYVSITRAIDTLYLVS